VVALGLSNRTFITGMIARVTEAFAGPAGPLTISVSQDDRGGTSDNYLLGFDPTTVVTKGLVDADLGPYLASMTKNVGYCPAWDPYYETTLVTVTLHSASGTLNELTAGSLTLYVNTRKMIKSNQSP
jgi:hypothetical protein